MTCKKIRFALKTSIVLLGFVFCFAFASRSDAQDASVSWQDRLELNLDEKTFDVPDGQTLSYYDQNLGRLLYITIETSLMYSSVDSVFKATREEKEEARALGLQSLVPIKTTIEKEIELSNKTGIDKDLSLQHYSRLSGTFDALIRWVPLLDAPDELPSLEQDLRKWRDMSNDMWSKKLFEEYALLIEADRRIAAQTGAGRDLVDVLFEIRIEENAKDAPNEGFITRLGNRIDPEIDRKIAENESEADKILQEAIDRESGLKQPGAYMLGKWLDALEEREWRRLVDADDVDGAVEFTRKSIVRAVERPTHWNMNRTQKNLNCLQQMNSDVADALFVETIDLFLASGDEKLTQMVAFIGRNRKLEGSKFALEGVCVDGTEINWNDYLGKPGVVLLFSARDYKITDDVKKLFAILRKFANCDDVNVIGYVADDDEQLRTSLNEETSWKTVSQELTLKAKDKKYRDFGVYYGLRTDLWLLASKTTHDFHFLPQTILFDERGVVQSIDMNLTAVENFLREKCSGAQDASDLGTDEPNKFQPSEMTPAKQLANKPTAVDRRDSLKGKRLIFRGSYYNPDDSSDSPTFDWHSVSSSGRPVLIFCYDLNNIDAGLEYIRGIYRKYYVRNNARLVVLGYYDGSPSGNAPLDRSIRKRREFAEEFK
ncbi:MAG: hypothetical protein IKX88_12000, partial [Thermoguttaceae bacterium]|nr:hypothetical protein [Thermoguttaceae bacterium]